MRSKKSLAIILIIIAAIAIVSIGTAGYFIYKAQKEGTPPKSTPTPLQTQSPSPNASSPSGEITLSSTTGKTLLDIICNWNVGQGIDTKYGFKFIDKVLIPLEKDESEPVYPGKNEYTDISNGVSREYSYRCLDGNLHMLRICALDINGQCAVYSNTIKVPCPLM